MPGHTEGHQALLVRLASGPVLISGDQYHFTENREVGGVPRFNVDRADTLASHDRFEKLARNLHANVIIQHEPDDVDKLPAFPEAELDRTSVVARTIASVRITQEGRRIFIKRTNK